MRWFKSKRPTVGATVICLREDGCMAETKVYQWTGKIVSFATQDRMRHESAVIQYAHRIDQHGDWRDRDLGITTVVHEENGMFQKIAPDLYFFYT